MPFFGSLLKSSSLPKDKVVNLEDLCSESKNPHLLTLSKVVSRIVRENTSTWVIQNLGLSSFPGVNFQNTTLDQDELKDRIFSTLAMVLEMMVACEFAREDLSHLFLIKNILMKCHPMVLLLQNHQQCSEIIPLVWEIHNSICASEGSKSKTLDSPGAYVLWGQALVKLARSYYLPQGPKEFGKTEYFELLCLANRKFAQCLDLISPQPRSMPLQLKNESFRFVATNALNGIGYTFLLKARATHDMTTNRSLLLDAKKAFNGAENLLPTANSTYNLACVCSMLLQDEEAKGWLELCKRDGTLPSVLHLQKDTDLEYARKRLWFPSILSDLPSNPVLPEPKISETLSPSIPETKPTPFYIPDIPTEKTTFPHPTDTNDKKSPKEISDKKRPTEISDKKSPTEISDEKSPTEISDEKRPTEFSDEKRPTEISDEKSPVEVPKPFLPGHPIQYTDDPELNDAITYDEDLNKLQSSLIREGFSYSTVIGMVLEVGRAKQQETASNIKNEENRKRLNYRLQQCGLKEKRVIPGDGNCQFSSISDQLFDTIDQACFVRKTAIDWLKKNKNWKLPNGAVLSEFAYDQDWEEFCEDLSKNGIWGNHLTLVAVAEHFGSKIRVISSVASDSFIIQIDPKIQKSPQTILLSHYAEYHYGSIMPLLQQQT